MCIRDRVLEQRIEGPEVSVFALTDGEQVVLLPPAQDHKRIGEGDTGPNTGGMGAYAPAPLLDREGLEEARRRVIEPTLATLRARGIDYRGVIYAGLMLTASGLQVIEFNCRFGDPECETLMPLLGPELAAVLLACATGRLAEAPPPYDPTRLQRPRDCGGGGLSGDGAQWRCPGGSSGAPSQAATVPCGHPTAA